MVFGRNYGEWRKWFAWFPVRLENGLLVWLEVVARYNGGYFWPQQKFVLLKDFDAECVHRAYGNVSWLKPAAPSPQEARP